MQKKHRVVISTLVFFFASFLFYWHFFWIVGQ